MSNTELLRDPAPALSRALGLSMVVLVAAGGAPLPATAGHFNNYCSHTARSAYVACRFDVADDEWIARGQCINVEDDGDRSECNREAKEEAREAKAECFAQRRARLEVCELVGEERYDPDFSPENFVHPDEIGVSVAANPYLPLIPGAEWVYEGGDEVVTDTVTDKIKLVEGVPCRVVLDVAEDDGEVIEVTDDWYAQDLQGNVWYCGEVSRNFETFEGDAPEEPELVDIDGTWKAGRDGAKPGILVLANPMPGDAYRQEVALGEAEDVAEVISVTGSETVPAASCNGDCMVTRDFTPLEPDTEEFKYYVPGIGLILEVDDEGERVELVEYTIP